jgi:hypothetical protein
MGISISKHYCNNELVSQEINSEPVSCCDAGCNSCHNETLSLKIEDKFQTISYEYNFQDIAILINCVSILFDNSLLEEDFIDYNKIESPPPLKTQRLLSKLQTYLC